MSGWTEEDIEKAKADNPDLAKANEALTNFKTNDYTEFKLNSENKGEWSKSANKYHARKTWSELCQRMFDSKAEARRGEELRMLELAGEIEDLRYQVRFVLFKEPTIKITIDFTYLEKGKRVFEDVKGVLTRDFRVKLAWLKKTRRIDVTLIK